MSAHDPAPADADEADAHDDHDDHGEAPPPEPESPAWLPLLGGALFLAGLLFFLITGANEPGEGSDAAASAAPSAAPPPPAPPPSAAALRPRRLPQNLQQLRPPAAGAAVGAQAPQAPKKDAPGHEGHNH